MANESARRAEDELEPEIEISDAEDSLVTDRKPKAPAMRRLGRYRIVCELASGGMATVNLAIADGLDKLLALKVIHPQLAKEESFVKMFLDEARIASSVSHRNVCNVFDYGEQEGSYYMAMDYLAGGTLRDVIRRLRGKRTPQGGNAKYAVVLAYIIAQACEGLHAAHELRGNDGALMEVVHRDVSPHNLFVTYDGDVSVVDFGIARASDRLQQTATGVLKGKFSYMAPEQIRQTKIDRRADIWALGVCLWEGLTQRRLFARPTQADTLMSVMADPIKTPSSIDAALPAQLDNIVMRALARDLDQRYKTAREMSRDLMAFCRESGTSMSPIELEHFMEELFPKEIVQSRELVRRAKQSASEDTDMYMPSHTHSGAMLRNPLGRALLSSGGTGVSNVTDSYSIDPAAARNTTVPAEQAPRSRGFLYGALSAGVLAAGMFFAMSGREPTPVPLAKDEPKTTVSVGSSAPAAIAAHPPAHERSVPSAVDAQPGVPDASAALQDEPTRLANNGPARAAARWSPRPNTRGRSSDPNEAAAAELVKSEARAALSEIKMADSRPDAAAPQVEAKPVEASAAAVAVVAVAPKAPAAATPAPVKPDNRPLDANVALGSIQTKGSLGSGAVSRMLGRTLPLMRACYQNAARSAARNDFAPLNLTFDIDESANVRNAKASAHALSGLSSCVSDAVKRTRADQKPDVGTVQVTVQVTFRGL